MLKRVLRYIEHGQIRVWGCGYSPRRGVQLDPEQYQCVDVGELRLKLFEWKGGLHIQRTQGFDLQVQILDFSGSFMTLT